MRRGPAVSDSLLSVVEPRKRRGDSQLSHPRAAAGLADPTAGLLASSADIGHRRPELVLQESDLVVSSLVGFSTYDPVEFETGFYRA